MAGAWQAEFVMRGDKELSQVLQRIAGMAPERVGQALAPEAQIELDEAVQRTPFEEGELAGSGTVHAPERDAEGVKVRITFGEGLAPYAVAQHEKFYRHETGQQRKFLESVIRESRPHMLNRVGRRLKLVP